MTATTDTKGHWGNDTGAAPGVPPYAIRIVSLHGMPINPPKGEWLVSFDPDGGDPDVPYPTGDVETSEELEKALRFASFQEAAECWKQQSTRTPLRPDGKANRPLAAFTCQIERLP